METKIRLIVLYCVIATNVFWTAWLRLMDLERPYRLQYSQLSDIQLIFGYEDEYDRMMRWMNKGGDQLDEMEKFMFKSASYIDELRHRRVGDIDWKAEKERAQKYVDLHSGFTP